MRLGRAPRRARQTHNHLGSLRLNQGVWSREYFISIIFIILSTEFLVLPTGRSRDIIISDLQREKPAWPLSSYGQKEDPCLLVGLDMSPEEMRWKAMQCQMKGDMNSYVS